MPIQSESEKRQDSTSATPTSNGRPANYWFDLSFAVNGTSVEMVVSTDRLLLDVLREDLSLTGTKLGCGVGVCGACTVLLDGEPISSCLTLAVRVDGREIVTVEGLSDIPQARRLQRAFISEGGFQCGYCTSGQLVAAAALIMTDQVPSLTPNEIREYMKGNLCRCTGYYGILRAIEEAAE